MLGSYDDRLLGDERIAPTAADVLIDTIHDWGAEVVFGLLGDGINGIVETLRKVQDRVRWTMTVQITIGPPVLTINRSNTFMVTDYNGEVDPLHAQGVFADDTRFVSAYRLLVNGRPWQRVSSATVNYYTARFYLINPQLEDVFSMIVLAGRRLRMPMVAGDSLGLTLLRTVDEGVRELFTVTNYSLDRVSVVLQLELKSDFADLFEVKSEQLRQRDNIVTEWHPKRRELATSYRDRDFVRRFTYRILAADHPPSYANGRILFPIHLDPGTSWHASADMLLWSEARLRRPQKKTSERARTAHERWLKTATTLDTPNQDLSQSYRQSVQDIGALRLLERDIEPNVWVPAAGVPWYVTLFGRDTLIASLQSVIVHPRFAEGALRILAQHQARERDDWRDAQPGKIMHEIRHGELAHFHLIPHTPYYGTWDATPLYLIALHEAWLWLADRKLIADLRPTAEACLTWIDNYGDSDGDGFQEYKTYSGQGYENMSWKDAQDSVVYPDGRQVKQPKALCELQGYVYAAKRGMAVVFAALGEHRRAETLASQADELKRRFNEAFWMEDEGTYAFGLDPEKRQIKTVASNPGHCLWTGIADADKAPRVVQRLLAPDMWSGWGIRTLSAQNPAYNPHSYQRGSVWPHDNGIIAMGMKRYGCHEQANQVARGILDAAAHFLSYRLPEVFSGLVRAPQSFPVQYRGANIPQAWAAGSIFHLLRAMLGLHADAPNGRLWVNPVLPDWIPSLELSGLQVGRVRLDLRFWREGARSLFTVKAERGGHVDVLAEEVEAGPQTSPG